MSSWSAAGRQRERRRCGGGGGTRGGSETPCGWASAPRESRHAGIAPPLRSSACGTNLSSDGCGWKPKLTACGTSRDGIRLSSACGHLSSVAGAADPGRERHLLTGNANVRSRTS
ncbi:unnamed protein product [Urochloa humidicola]